MKFSGFMKLVLFSFICIFIGFAFIYSMKAQNAGNSEKLAFAREQAKEKELENIERLAIENDISRLKDKVISSENKIEENNDTEYTLIGHKKVTLEIAADNDSRATGLMHRTSMPENHGMIFIFDNPDFVNFWMKNVKISLDMIFISDSKIVKIYKNTLICKAEPCRLYSSNVVVDSVIELNGGFCEKNNIKEGDSIQFSKAIKNEFYKKSQ